MISVLPLKHLAIIMDGNGRWAEQKGLTRLEGHLQGSKSAELMIEQCLKYNIPYLTLFAFSTENWGRPAKEVNFLMELLEKHLITKSEKFISQNIRLETIGDLSKLPSSLQSKLAELKSKTKLNTKLTVIFALNYGGRDEIKNAALKLASDIEQNRVSKFNFTSDDFAKYLETSDWPDPDLIIRTSGEQRISNFLLWQSAYSEFYFTNKLWPDFDGQDFYTALKNYYDRHRKFGCLDDSTSSEQHSPEGIAIIHDIRKKQTHL
jgi:undecaprenyl diphosphate synthase